MLCSKALKSCMREKSYKINVNYIFKKKTQTREITAVDPQNKYSILLTIKNWDSTYSTQSWYSMDLLVSVSEQACILVQNKILAVTEDIRILYNALWE